MPLSSARNHQREQPPKRRQTWSDLSRQNCSRDLTEVRGTHHNPIAVKDEFALGAVGHGDGLGAAPRDFKHGAEGARLRAADGAARHHVAGAEVATVDRVVGQLLAHVPVHVAEIGAADHLA